MPTLFESLAGHDAARTIVAAALPDADRLKRLLQCAERELAMRKRVYPARVATSKMAQTTAAAETDAMADIADVLRLLQLPTNEPDLFTAQP